MKTLLKLLLLLLLIFNIGCSDNDIAPDEVNFQTNELSEPSSTARTSFINSFLQNYYKTTNYSFGESIVLNDTDIDYNITEVILGADTVARGYFITDDETDRFLYFADVDRVNHTMQLYDITDNDVQNLQNLDSDSFYLETGYDFIKIVKDELYQVGTQRFWGWECGAEYQLGGQCVRNCVYYVLWRSVPTELTPYPEPVFSCGGLPGKNPRLN